MKEFKITEMLATRVDESWTHHFQLGPTKVFKLSILTILGLNKIFRNVFWAHQIKLLQISLTLEKHVFLCK
jgi:hypothetical protein